MIPRMVIVGIGFLIYSIWNKQKENRAKMGGSVMAKFRQQPTAKQRFFASKGIKGR